MNKEQFFKQKLANFTKLIETEIGKDNAVYKDFVAYQADIDLFLKALVQLSAFAQNGFDAEHINKYLEYKQITQKVESKTIDKCIAYFNMFIDVLAN